MITFSIATVIHLHFVWGAGRARSVMTGIESRVERVLKMCRQVQG